MTNIPQRQVLAAAAAVTLFTLPGCDPGMTAIDDRVEALLIERSGELGPPDEAPAPRNRVEGTGASADRGWSDDERTTAEWLATDNPDLSELSFIPEPRQEAAQLIERLRGYSEEHPESMQLDLSAAVAYAIKNSRDYRFNEEDYILACLSLLSEQHLWGPRFFNDLSVALDGSGTGSSYDATLQVVNDLQITQRLPDGGEVALRVIAAATEDLHSRFSVGNESFQSADIILSADIPLLRGAGTVAREDLIQSYRDVIYATREFERFRREFVVTISTAFLNLVVQQQGITNSQRQVAASQEVERREKALVVAGRLPPFEAAFAAQQTLFSIDRLNGQLETYRVAVDSFKVLIGMPDSAPLVIDASSYDLPTPETDLEEAVVLALTYRLDLQNTRDQVDDARRGYDNAENALLPDLDFAGSLGWGTTNSGIPSDDYSYSAGLTLGLPLDRTIERVNVRTAQISLERSVRDYSRTRDTVALEVRSSIREIDRARLSLELQEENIRNAQIRQDSIEAAPARANTRDRTEAINQYLAALDARDSARRDFQVAILEYLLDSGQLRVDEGGRILIPPDPFAAPAPPEPDNPGPA